MMPAAFMPPQLIFAHARPPIRTVAKEVRHERFTVAESTIVSSSLAKAKPLRQPRLRHFTLCFLLFCLSAAHPCHVMMLLLRRCCACCTPPCHRDFSIISLSFH